MNSEKGKPIEIIKWFVVVMSLGEPEKKNRIKWRVHKTILPYHSVWDNLTEEVVLPYVILWVELVRLKARETESEHCA